MVISMRSLRWRHFCRFLSVAAAMMAAIPAAHARPEPNPAADPGKDRVCSNLGEYIFIGGTGGFNALRFGDQFEDLLKSGRVGLYEHGNAIDAAEESPGLLEDIERVFRGT